MTLIEGWLDRLLGPRDYAVITDLKGETYPCPLESLVDTDVIHVRDIRYRKAKLISWEMNESQGSGATRSVVQSTPSREPGPYKPGKGIWTTQKS